MPAPRLRLERSPVGTDAGLVKAAQFLDIKMEEIAWGGVLVADDRGLGRFEGAEAVEAVAAARRY